MKIRVTNGMNRRDVELPMSDSELTLHMKQIGVDESIPKCKLIEVRDKGNPIAPFIGQIVNLDEVNFLAKRMESLTDYERNVMEAYVTERGVEEIKDLINLTFSLKGLSLITDFSDGEQVGKRLYLDEFLGMSEEESRQINFTEFAEKTFAEQSCKILPYGVWVEHGFEMQEVYNGRTFPLYCYDSDKVAALEIENQRGDTEYLYLPTDICSVNKMKARLQVQDFWECKVKEVHNFHIPDSILPRPEDIKCIEDLTFFNELCQNICRFDEQKMKQLSMAVEFVGVKDFTDMTYIARTLSEFEIHSDEEYGKYLVSDEGLFDVDDLLLSHIDYAGLARDKRQGTLTDSGYVSEGFVGANRDIHEYMEYEGEFADPLEIDEDCFQTFRLFSPLTGQLYVDGEDARNLYRSDLTPYEEEIMEAIRNEECIGEEARGLMHYFDESREVAGKVLRATPAVQVLNGELYGVLECKISEPMTEEDIKVLKDYWTGQMSEGWGEGFEQHPIKIDEGELYVSFWNSESFWSVMTAEELAVMQEQADYSDCGL